MSASGKDESLNPQEGERADAGEDLREEKVQGDKVGGDKITVGDITDSSGVAIGSGASATVTSRSGDDQFTLIFAPIYEKIQERPEDPDVDKEEIVDTVQKIEQEAARGEQANPNRVERWLGTLAIMAPDIFDVAVASLTSPAAGIASVIRKVAEKAREENQKSS